MRKTTGIRKSAKTINQRGGSKFNSFETLFANNSVNENVNPGFGNGLESFIDMLRNAIENGETEQALDTVRTAIEVYDQTIGAVYPTLQRIDTITKDREHLQNLRDLEVLDDKFAEQYSYLRRKGY